MIGSVASLVGVGGAPLMSICLGEGDEKGSACDLGQLLPDVVPVFSGTDGDGDSVASANAAVFRRE